LQRRFGRIPLSGLATVNAGSTLFYQGLFVGLEYCR